MFHHSTSKRRLLRPLVGAVVATPVVAILQGALLLQEYRAQHGDAPRPDMPSRGIVIVEQGNHNNNHRDGTTYFALPRRRRSYESPLRILIIGDSLAAGVGMSQSSTPALPESIAKALSQALDGRAVYWTCMGTPGASATELVEEIHNLDDALPTPLIRRLVEWQNASRERAHQRIEAAKTRAMMFWQEHNKEPLLEDVPMNQVARWWKTLAVRVRRDVQNLGKVLQQPPQDDFKDTSSQALDKRVNKMVRRNSLDPTFIKQYDVAIVLTGLNDLKDSFLPFMMSARRAKLLAEAKLESDGSLKGELMRIVHALQARMGRDTGNSVDSSVTALSPVPEVHDEKRGPLVVFPAMPYAPIELSRTVPLSWFLVPLIRAMDRNKKVIADMLPNLVLYVETPDLQVFEDAEAKRGPLWEGLSKVTILLQLTDMRDNVKEKVESLMRKHYKSLVADAEDNEQSDDSKEQGTLYEIDDEGVSLERAPSTRHYPGSTMVAADGVHPNDRGYELWGRYIALEILNHWKLQGKT